MDLLPLPPESDASLRGRSVSEPVLLGVRLVITCLDEVCGWVVDDTSDAHRDDSTSEGQLRWRRCRNYVKELLDRHAVDGLEEAVADVSDNALVVRVAGCCLSFYSARNGIDQPDLSGRSKTKERVVTEMQLQLEGLAAPNAPERLVVLYEADGDGLTRAAVGMLGSQTQWAWQVAVYQRPTLTLEDSTTEDGYEAPPSYDQQPPIALPEMPPKSRDEDDEAGEDASGGTTI